MIHEGTICAQCITALHDRYPITAQWWHPENDSTMSVNSWEEAADAVANGYVIRDQIDGVTHGVFARTLVAGTALCFSHAALAQGRADRDLRRTDPEFLARQEKSRRS